MSKSSEKEDVRFGAVVLQDFPWGKLVELWQNFETLGFDKEIPKMKVKYWSKTTPLEIKELICI